MTLRQKNGLIHSTWLQYHEFNKLSLRRFQSSLKVSQQPFSDIFYWLQKVHHCCFQTVMPTSRVLDPKHLNHCKKNNLQLYIPDHIKIVKLCLIEFFLKCMNMIVTGCTQWFKTYIFVVPETVEWKAWFNLPWGYLGQASLWVAFAYWKKEIEAVNILRLCFCSNFDFNSSAFIYKLLFNRRLHSIKVEREGLRDN